MVNAGDAREEAWAAGSHGHGGIREVRQACCVREQTRFRRVNAVSARSRALGLAREGRVRVVSGVVAAKLPAHDSEAPPCWEQDNHFAEISPLRLHHSLWAVRCSAAEARAANRAMKRVCGVAASMNTHHLFLCANMAVNMSFDRFRARSWRLLVQIRRFASFAMSLGIRHHARWVPSELNPADAPRRNRIANIKTHFSASALAYISDLHGRAHVQNEAEARVSGIRCAAS